MLEKWKSRGNTFVNYYMCSTHTTLNCPEYLQYPNDESVWALLIVTNHLCRWAQWRLIKSSVKPWGNPSWESVNNTASGCVFIYTQPEAEAGMSSDIMINCIIRGGQLPRLHKILVFHLLSPASWLHLPFLCYYCRKTVFFSWKQWQR